jgi:hypothetical protein
MPVPAPQPQNSQVIAVIVFLVAALCVRYWRTALRLIVIAVITLTVLGLIVGLHGIHSAAR